jgi:excisionase family DNA binding protein
MNFFEEQQYEKSKLKFDTGKIWEKLVSDYNNFTDKQLRQFYEEFTQIKHYGDKLRFWKQNHLSPMKLQYKFRLTIENHPKLETVVLSLYPINNEEQKQYLQWVIEQCYENYTLHTLDYQFETIPFEELKQRFQRLKGDTTKNIELEISLTKQRIKRKQVDTDVYSYLTYRKNEPNILSDLQISSGGTVVSLQYFAIQTAFVYDFLEYLLFLEDCKLDIRTILRTENEKTTETKEENYKNEKKVLLEILQTKNVLTTEEAALYLSVSIPTLRNLRKDNAIPSHQPKSRGNIFYKREDLNEWLSNNRQSDNRMIEKRVSDYFLQSKF